MKKNLVLVTLSLLMTVSVSAQSIYLRAGTGYGLAIAPASLGENYTQTSTNSVSTYSNESVTGSYGAGGNFNLTFGYELNKNFIIELNTQYIISKKYKTSYNYSYIGTGYSYVDNSNTTTSGKGLLFNPSVIFSAGFGKAAPYGRFGFIFGSPKMTEEGESYDDGDGITTVKSKVEYSKGLAFGFQGAVGMNWELSGKLDLFTELNFISLTYYAGEANLTEYSRNSNDYLPDMPLSQTQIIYKKKYNYTDATYDPSKATIALRESAPFSSLSLQVGIRFYLWTVAE